MLARQLNQRRLGITYALIAYGIWGLLPLYLRGMSAVPPIEIVAHRIVWSFLLLIGLLALQGGFQWLRKLWLEPRIALSFAASASMLSINWFVYIWATLRHRVVDASLGYFINPLFSVILGVLVLKERLRVGQWAAIAVAGLGVAWLSVLAGQLPWIGLILASSFGIYGLLRKTAALEALAGLTLETTLLLPAALGYLIWLSLHGGGIWSSATLSLRGLLVAAGPITAIPLLSFAAGARRIPLSLVGILQYVGPTLQLLLGTVVFHEPFSAAKLIGFALIWLSLALYTFESWRFGRSGRAPI